MAEKPMLILASTEDEFFPYSEEAVYLFDHLRAPEKYLSTFIGRSHMMGWDEPTIFQIRQFVTVFFETYLQGCEDYRKYFNKDFISHYDDLALGIFNP